MTDSQPPNTSVRQVLSVSELNRMAKQLLEIHMPLMWIEGEISNFTKPSSGHWYFTLKDDNAQVRCAMFRGRNTLVRFTPKTGDKLVVRARVSLYEGRGDYQLIVEHMEDAGFGMLQRRFDALKQQLQQEGLFDPSRKQAIPCPPAHLAVVTSPSGAAIKDVLSVLKRRFPVMPVTIIPALVQGEDAPQQLINALQVADRSNLFDAILLTRGGGSIEDLWAFNSEALARTISACETPIVSAVGHEIDYTIADFVADLRAPTPSAAAELLSPSQTELLGRLADAQIRLEDGMRRCLADKLRQIAHLRQRIRHPGQQLETWSQRLDQSEMRMRNALLQQLRFQHAQVTQLDTRLSLRNPAKLITQKRELYQSLNKRLHHAVQFSLQNMRERLEHNCALLNLVSPLSTLKRGYSIVKDNHGTIIRTANQTTPGAELKIVTGSGHIQAIVTESGKENGDSSADDNSSA